MNGFIVVDKEKGMSSSAVVSVVKGVTKHKAGHLGTLDPEATGVLPVAIGKATRLFDFLLSKTKKYVADFTFGTITDTLDCAGTVLATCHVIPDINAVKAALKGFVGEISQLPPQYSALSVGGVRAYKLARNGVNADLKPRNVTISSYRLIEQVDDLTYRFEIQCSSGTYIRALARDLGHACDSLAYMSALRRISSGPFSLDNAVSLERLRADWQTCVLDVEYAISSLPSYNLPPTMLSKLINGVRIPSDNLPDGLFKVYCNDKLFGLGKSVNNQLQITVNLYDND